MLGSVTGFLGSGKTLFLAYLATLEKERKIYANFNIKLDNASLITPYDIDNIDNGLLLIDEAYMWLDSRLSQSKMNKHLSRMVFKSRKKGLDIFLSTQLHGAIDLRFRHLEDITIMALGESKRYNKRFEYIIDYKQYRKTFLLPFKYAHEFLFPIYDTLEFPEEEHSEFSPERFNEAIEDYANDIIREYGEIKLTKGIVEDFILEHNDDISIADNVYNRIKRKQLIK